MDCKSCSIQPVRTARAFAAFVCVESACSLLSGLLVQQKVLKNTFSSQHPRGGKLLRGCSGALSEISEKLFFRIPDKRKGEIDHLNYSQASDLSSFKGFFCHCCLFPTMQTSKLLPRLFRIAKAIWQIIFSKWHGCKVAVCMGFNSTLITPSWAELSRDEIRK